MLHKAKLRLNLLGPARVEKIDESRSEEVEDNLPRFRSRRTIGLLGYLVAEQRPVARDFLAALFWPDEDPSKARANLSRELHNLAQILTDCWESDRQMVAFEPSEEMEVDLHQIVRCAEQERWSEAADYACGEFLEGLVLDHNPDFENWLLGERERWREFSSKSLKHVVDGYIRRGRYADALQEARRMLKISPWQEETHVLVMKLLAWIGQRGAALRQYKNCEQVLWEEVGIQPGAEANDLYEQILNGTLALPPQLPAFLTTEKARVQYERPPFVGREEELGRLDLFLQETVTGQGKVIFVTGGPGRGKTALLEAFAQRAIETHPNLLVATGKCSAYSRIGDPYLPYRDIMTLITGDVEANWDAGTVTRDYARRLWSAFPAIVQVLLEKGPHLLDVMISSSALLSRSLAAGQDNQPWLNQLKAQIKRNKATAVEIKQRFLFEQMSEFLFQVARERPLLLIIDDLQWADTASISLLFHLGRRLAEGGCRFLMACAYRPEEVPLDQNGDRHSLAKALREMKRHFGDVWVDLRETEKETGRKFVDALLDLDPNHLSEKFRASLFERTDGHPLFTVELLRSMRERGDLHQNSEGLWVEGPSMNWTHFPSRVEAVIEERIERLDGDLRELLSIASVEGEVFTAQVVARVARVDERYLLRKISQELERRHRLVRENQEIETRLRRMSRYRFGHVLYTEYLYSQLSAGERRLIHQEIAEVLEELHAGELDEIAVQLAQHYDRAENTEKAFYFYARAAERAFLLYANKEGIAHASRAIQMGGKLKADVNQLATLLRGRGLASKRVGEFEQAHCDHTEVLKIARAAGKDLLAWQAQIDLGRLWASRDHRQAQKFFEGALEIARQINDPALLGVALNWMGNWFANDESPQKAMEFHQQALKIFEELSDRHNMAKTLDLLGVSNLLAGEFSASAQFYNRSVNIFREIDDRPMLVSSLMGRASLTAMQIFLAAHPTRPLPDALADFAEASRLAREIGSTPDEAWAHWSLGLVHTVQGDFGQALMVMQSGLGIASEIDHREWEIYSRFSLAILYTELFALDQARKLLEEALKQAVDLQSPHHIHLVSGVLAGTFLAMNDLQKAQACLDRVLTPQTDTVARRYCWVRRAELAFAQNDPLLGLDITQRLISSTPANSSKEIITHLWQLKGEGLARTGRVEKGCVLLNMAIENAHERGEKYLLWRLYGAYGRICRAAQHTAEAKKAFATAQAIIDELAATISDKDLKYDFQNGAAAFLERNL